MEKRIIIGSRAFFDGMPDFQSKDTDVLLWTDEPKGYKHYKQTSMSGRCTMEWAKKPKDEFLSFALRERACGLEFGKFLVAEFASELGLTISNLTMLYEHFKGRIDEKHKYQHEVYKAYVENNGIYLTDKQREQAYKVYKAERPEYFAGKSNTLAGQLSIKLQADGTIVEGTA